MTRPGDAPTVVAPTPLPVRDDDSLDHDALARNVERWNRTPLSGFVIGSAGGEELYFGVADRLQAIRTVSAVSSGSRMIIGGIDTPGSSEAVRLATAMAEAGADHVRVRIPQAPGGRSRGDVVSYFEQVTAGSPVPVIVIHQTWQTGGHAAEPEEIGAICSLDNVFAYVCWQDLRYESYVRLHVPAHVRFWTPNASLLLPGVAIGATGACCFFANWAAHAVVEVLQYALAGRLADARDAQQRLLAADFLGMKYGVRALKAGLNLLGFEGTVPRRPVAPLGPAEAAELARAFETAGLLDRNIESPDERTT